MKKKIFRGFGKIFSTTKKNINQEKYAKSLLGIKNEIDQFDNIDDILNYIIEYYDTYYSIDRLNYLMNSTIFLRKQELKSKFSLKIMVQLYLYLLIKHSGSPKKSINASNELEIFFFFLNVLQTTISNYQVDESVKYGRSDNLQSYLNYHFDFRKEIWEYYEISRMFDDIAIEKYDFSIYQNFDKLLYIICNVKYTSNGLILGYGQFSDKELHKIFGTVNYHNLFIEYSEDIEINYLTSSLQVIDGAIGIKKGLTYFLPTTEHILCNIEQKLINSAKNKGSVLETELKKFLEENFGVSNVHQSLYLMTEKKEEQDFVVEVGDKILLIECKARDFKEIPFNPKMSEDRRRQLFKKVILEAAEQANRAKRYIINNKVAIFTDNKGISERLRIENKNYKKIYKVVVILDDYYKLSETAIDYFKQRDRSDLFDTWVVNFFDLQRIFWHSGKTEMFDYIDYRTSGIENINSIQASELAQYGYYISPNYNFVPPNDLNMEVNLMGRFEDWAFPFDKMKNESVLKQIGVYK